LRGPKLEVAMLRKISSAITLAAVALAVISNAAGADDSEVRVRPEIAARLDAAQLQKYVAWRRAQNAHARRLDHYWGRVEDRRDVRRRKFAAKEAFVAADYVGEQPPTYAGPGLPTSIAKILAEIDPPRPGEELPGLADFLDAAKRYYGFEPTRTSEIEFKRRYAREAVAVGLRKDQVVRVYALETGGDGTFDMQAGIHPLTKKGRPISSALGYAQLLAANSVSELVSHGEEFRRRLAALAASAGTDARRRRELEHKSAVLARMLEVARSVPNQWSRHVELARTPRGYGIHVLNLDADIGPWLQVLKLEGLLKTAQRAGITRLSGAELELMNLAGPRTGLEMMQPIGRTMPTANFFSRRAYYRNTIVRERTGAELLVALDERMEVGLKKAGAIEFARVFESLPGARPERTIARERPRPAPQTAESP
jgi:hypothetical protein